MARKYNFSPVLCGSLIIIAMFLTGCRCMRCPGDLLSYTDIGNVTQPGSVKYLRDSREYAVTGSGANIWGTEDSFHYLWKQATGNWSMKAKVQWQGTGKNAHRKAGWMIRQDLTPDSPYVDAVLHGDGLASMQFRKTKGGETQEIQSPVRNPAYVCLQRKGQVFTFSVSADGVSYQTAGIVSVPLKDPVYMGVAVCAHDNSVLETAIFSDVEMKSL